jgi:ribonuclease P protein component
MRENGLGFPRLGISIRKSAGGAVHRNRIKRYLREAFRRNSRIQSLSLDIVVVATDAGDDITFATISCDFNRALSNRT